MQVEHTCEHEKPLQMIGDDINERISWCRCLWDSTFVGSNEEDGPASIAEYIWEWVGSNSPVQNDEVMGVLTEPSVCL